MPVWYTRQSSAEIVTDQVIEASDFNNEYNAIATAFAWAFAGTFGVGHDHTGTMGMGPLILLTGTTGVTGVSGVLAAQFGGVKTATTDPTTTDDTPDFVKGSLWVNTSSKTTFVCTDNTSTAAVWQKLQGVRTANAPTINDDIADGYQVGHVWVRTGVSPNAYYICVDNSAGAAVWVTIAQGKTQVTASAPTVTDSGTFGYREGSIWVNTSTDKAYVNVDATDGAAIWKQLSIVPSYSVKTSAYQIVDGDNIFANTSGGAFGLTAPSAATDDVRFTVADYNLTFDVSPVHLTGSFAGITGTFVLDIKGGVFNFVSNNSLFRIV